MPRHAARALLALAASSVLLALAAPTAASADEAACAGTYFTGEGRELFDVPQSSVPAPLRGTDPDCASHLVGDGGDTITDAYDLLYVDIPFEKVIAIVRAFEAAGWVDRPISTIDFGPGDTAFGQSLGADDLAALTEVPPFLQARFSDQQTGRHIISLDYSDGQEYVSVQGITTPTLVVQVLLNGPLDSATGFGDASVLSNLKLIQDSLLSPTQSAVLCGSAIMLTLIIGYPGSLLGSVVGARYDSVMAWLRSKLKPRERTRPLPKATSWLVWPGFVVAAIIGGFVDPAFGPNLMSLRVLLSGFLSFLVFNLAVWMLVRAVLRRVQPDAQPYIRFRWGSLVVVLVTVLVARLLQFDPGVIFGLVAGLAFGMTLALSRDALVILLGSGFGLVAALIGWVGYSLLAPNTGGNPALVFVSEFFSGMTIEGVSSLPLALLPLAALDGATLLKWKKWVWGVAYAVGLAAFMFVLLSVPGSFAEMRGDFLRWLSLFGIFAVVAVGLWGIDTALTRRKKQHAA